jgi:hypothetical protein
LHLVGRNAFDPNVQTREAKIGKLLKIKQLIMIAELTDEIAEDVITHNYDSLTNSEAINLWYDMNSKQPSLERKSRRPKRKIRISEYIKMRSLSQHISPIKKGLLLH